MAIDIRFWDWMKIPLSLYWGYWISSCLIILFLMIKVTVKCMTFLPHPVKEKKNL